MNLVSLQLKTTQDFNHNLEYLVSIIKKEKENSFILAPELALTGYSYDNIENASLFTSIAIEKLLKLSSNKTISITMITKTKVKDKDLYLNTFYIFYKNKIVHSQSKNKLFVLNDERKYFSKGKKKDIKVFEIDNIKIAVLICFELRFSELWKKIEGADIILIPTMWGKKREKHLSILSKSLAVLNQCFVVVSDSANDDMAKNSAIITPFGKVYKDNKKEIIKHNINLKEIELMRRYMNVGIK
ncbi:MAG: carbon-nitrogen hydrolase family protein [Campylobacterota bacterium]|nr:carbon-nitrogen hydrolase family protein [Campylobacterota bacterium]